MSISTQRSTRVLTLADEMLQPRCLAPSLRRGIVTSPLAPGESSLPDRQQLIGCAKLPGLLRIVANVC